MDSTQLNDVLASKIEELNGLSVTDENFKDATNAVCNLAETQAKIESHSTEKKLKWWQIALGVVGCVTPFVLSAYDKKHYDMELNKVLEYEKTGGIISSGGKSVLSGLKIGKK
jgi:hypothetical protein